MSVFLFFFFKPVRKDSACSHFPLRSRCFCCLGCPCLHGGEAGGSSAGCGSRQSGNIKTFAHLVNQQHYLIHFNFLNSIHIARSKKLDFFVFKPSCRRFYSSYDTVKCRLGPSRTWWCSPGLRWWWCR